MANESLNEANGFNSEYFKNGTFLKKWDTSNLIYYFSVKNNCKGPNREVPGRVFLRHYALLGMVFKNVANGRFYLPQMWRSVGHRWSKRVGRNCCCSVLYRKNERTMQKNLKLNHLIKLHFKPLSSSHLKLERHFFARLKKLQIELKSNELFCQRIMTTGLNFINVLCTAFTHVDPKSIKRYWQLDWVLMLWGATGVKTDRRMLMKSTPVLAINGIAFFSILHVQ